MSSSDKGHEFTVFRGSESGAIHKETTKRGPLTGDQVLIRVTHSGLCFTDVHYRNSGQALGHEGVGVVEELGPETWFLKKGDTVGMGYVHDSCGHCTECLASQEPYCLERRALYGLADFDLGTFASHTVWREKFVFKLPEGIPAKYAGPLQCGGATVFQSFEAVGTQPTDRVGVLGIGGLGHLAIQFASKMGCHVTVFSGTESKRDEALKLGARDFYAMKDAKEIKTKHQINHLVITTNKMPDWNLILPNLAYHARITIVTVDPSNFEIPNMELVLRGLRVQGNIVPAPGVHTRMLEFAAEHKILPMIEEFPMTADGIEKAFERLNEGKMRYRAVLTA